MGVVNTIRAFIAVSLPPAVQAALGRLSQTLAAQVPTRSVRWVKPELMHLTLRFLGDTAVSQLPAITAALDQVAVTQAPFTLHLGTLGGFPNRRRPRVIWVGLASSGGEIGELKQAIDACLVPLGWDVEDRPFQSHLTLGRVNDGRQLAGLNWDMGVGVERLVVPVTAIHLIESQLRPDGPIYTIRHSSHLRL